MTPLSSHLPTIMDFSPDQMKQAAPLQRSLSLFQITFYGIGTILGAGIYVLLGEVVNISGNATPLAFILSAIIVSFSAYSYAQLSRKFPFSAGEAVYIMEGLRSRTLATLAGVAIVLGGVVSSATLINGFTGYFKLFAQLPETLTITAVVIVFCAITCWGIKQSVAVAVITTLVEIAGLIMVFVSGSDRITTDIDWRNFSVEGAQGLSIVSGAYLAFYAFIGFEDMVNIAEEVKRPRRHLPVAIFLALLVTTILYAAVAIVALAVVPLDQLSESRAPLALVVEKGGIFPPRSIAIIGMVAILNGAMIQIIMASRVLYGMANKGLGLKFLGQVNATTHTPVVATVLVCILIAGFALWLPLVTLAKVTSSLILLVFVLVNLSLASIYRRERQWRLLAIPVLGATLCAAFAGLQIIY